MAAPTRRRGATAEAPGGPHDEDDVDPAASADLVDFGAVRIPVPAGGTVSTDPAPAGGRPQAVHVTLPEGRLSVSALAAPMSERLWPELASEITAALHEGGARVRSYPGDWGRELHVVTGPTKSLFVGVDGPRWMVYGVATGPAADADALDAELRRLLRGTVVVRGRAPYPVRTVLPLTLPPGFEPPPVEPALPRVDAAPPVDATQPVEVVPPVDAVPPESVAPSVDSETTLVLPRIPVAEPPPTAEDDTVPDLEPVTQPLPVVAPAPTVPAPPPAPPRPSARHARPEGRHARPEPESAPRPRDGSEPALAFLVDDPLALFTQPTRPGRHRRRA